MLFTTHALTGAAIGAAVQNPVLAFVLGFASHHILDSIPHFDQGSFYIEEDKGPEWAGAKYDDSVPKFKVKRDWAILFADWFVAGVIFLYLGSRLPASRWLPLICGALGGLMPDIFDVSPLWKYKFRRLRIGAAFHKFHDFFHWPLSVRYIYIGLATQIIVLSLDLWLIAGLFK